MESVIYSNLQSFEGTVTGTVTETLTDFLYSRRVQVTNDSGSSDLLFYPKGVSNGTYVTLKPTETLTLDRFRSPTFSVSGTGVPYRVWIWG
jgi:hypothetical protein